MRPFATVTSRRVFFSAIRILGAAAWLASAAGCAHPWPPSIEHLRAADETTISDLADYSAPPGTRKVFRRIERGSRRGDAERYEVILCRDARVEGRLCGRIDEPLDAYLADGDNDQKPARFNWPDARGTSHAAFFMRFEPALGCTPDRMTGGGEQACESELQIFNWQGRPTYQGRVSRHLRFEGFDTIRVGKRTYEDCLLLRAEMHFRFPWIARVDTTEYIWLAPGIGEVRRLARWRGFVFLAFFDEMSNYELAEYYPGTPKSQPSDPATMNDPGTPEGFLRAWRQCAVFLQPALPHPQLAGLVLE